MKSILLLSAIFCFGISSFAQQPKDVLAIANGRDFTAQDLSPKISEAWLKKTSTLANARKVLLDRQIENFLLETEAADKNTTIGKLIEDQVEKKVADPTDSQIKAVYDANQADIGDTPLSEVRQKIVEYLRQDPEKKAFADFVGGLRARHGITYEKDVRSDGLKPTDVLATVGSRQITLSDFTDKNGLVLYEYEANIYDEVNASLRQAVDASLFSAEAEAYGIATSEYIAREVTNKMVDFSDAEQARLLSALQKQLYAKYRVTFLIREPKPFVQDISIDDDPFTGEANAPVTVVMFTDLQCPACAAVYPILKEVIAEYGKRVKFVIRDFPLTNIHEDAFQAAIAANAARSQNKFFEYKELLYKNQNSLDTASLIKLAGQLGLDTKRFANDLNKKEFAEEVRKDMEDGEKYGVNSTPTIFVNGIKVRVLSAESFREAIDRFQR